LIWDSQVLYNTNTFFWFQLVNQEKVAQSFIINRKININEMMLVLFKTWNPLDNMIVRIETDNWSDVPSGNLLHPNATIVVSWSNIYPSALFKKYSFGGFFDIPSWVKCWIVFARSW
jgi:hypothetical protein